MDAWKNHLSSHLQEVFFGGNWTSVNVKTTLEDITYEEAIYQRDGFNSILTIAWHMNYYVNVIKEALLKGELNAKDEWSFHHPEITTPIEWDEMKKGFLQDAEALIRVIHGLDSQLLPTIFIHEKYGSFARNFSGLIEHTHYHLGQIIILKKLLRK